MTDYVIAGTALAVVLIFVRCASSAPLVPSRWRIPEVGPALMVLFGTNAMASAIKLVVLLVGGDIGTQNGGQFEVVGQDDAVVFLAGALGAFLAGLVTTRDGLAQLF